MRLKALGVAAAVAALGSTAFASMAGAQTPHHSAAVRPAAAAAAKPMGHFRASAPQKVVLRSLPNNGNAARTFKHRTLGENGKPTGSNLPSRPTTGHKPVSQAPQVPQAIANGFEGTNQGTSQCGGCYPSDVNAAVGPNYIVEATNSSLAVYTKAGTLVQNTALTSLLGTSDFVGDARVLYDPTWNRWALVVGDFTSNATPIMYTAYSATSDPTGGWWIWAFGLPGTSTNGIIDFPMIGMDQNAYIYSVNLYNSSEAYTGSEVFSVPKARVYNGWAWGAYAWGVAFGTAPPIIGGAPSQQPSTDYLIAPDDANNVMYVYTLVNSSTPTPGSFKYKGSIPYTWAAPSRQVNQPGTTATLDPSDGRIPWATTQLDNRIWFAHGVDLGGFPSVQWGDVQPGSMQIHTAYAFHTASSDDFNPSITAQKDGTATRETLSWAYTDTPNGVPTTPVYGTFSGVVPGFIAGNTTRSGVGVSSEGRFGDFSSATPEYNSVGSCGVGKNAVVAQQYFGTDGTWKTRLARVHPGTC